MNKKIKLLTALLSATIFVPAFAGYDKKEETKPAGEIALKDVSLKLAVWDFTKAPEYQQLIDTFQSDNPHIKVEALDIPAQRYDDKLTAKLASGDSTDVIALKDMPSYSNYAQKKQIIGLDDYNKVESDAIHEQS